MAGELDVLVLTERDAGGGAKKNWWTRVGRAFPDKSGEGYTVVLDALPAGAVGGQAKLYLKPPRARDSGEGGL